MTLRILILCFSFCYLLVSCQTNQLPHSNFYKPLDEKELKAFTKADKSILPDDVKNNIGYCINKSVVWTGIVDTIIFQNVSDTLNFANVYLQHRYFDFIEDYGQQTEIMFLSPHGEGNYIFRQLIPKDVSIEQFKSEIAHAIFKECLIFSYGKVSGLEDGKPVLRPETIRVVFPEHYATNIFSYKVRRKNNGELVMKNGWPELINFEKLKVCKAGRNQIGSKLHNSTN